jgi:hypothetical protein
MPVAESYRDTYELGTGHDMVNPEVQLSAHDRLATLFFAALPGMSGAEAREADSFIGRALRGSPEELRSGGRLGSTATRQHVAEVAEELENRGWKVEYGGQQFKEEYIPGPGGARKGSAYPDITATKKGRALRINTIDTLSDAATPTAREAANAAKIRQLKPNEHLLLVPKRKR